MTRTAVLLLLAAALSAADRKIGLFESSTDVGVTPAKGSVEFDAASGEYRVTGGGENMWQKVDAFHFLWSRLSGDVAITADVKFAGAGVVAHRKAAVVIRQNLEPGSAYADVAVHGDGLTALQYRPAADALTQEVRSEIKGPVRVRIERRGNTFTMFAGNPGEELKPGGPVTVALQDPVYVGLGVCSHEADIVETAVFSNVKLEALPAAAAARPRMRSKLSIYNLKDNSTEVIYTADKLFEAPNWSRDGEFLLINSGGNLYRVPVDRKGAEPEQIDLGGIGGCNNDHGISPDGKRIAFSARHNAPGSQVYLANADGSNARLMTPKTPSYYHGWSPDGKWLAYTAQRGGEFDVYRMSVDGGEEERLTTAKGLDDGPDYSPDGKWIYVNSDRTGNFDIWRFPAGGSGAGDAKAQQVTSDEWEDWFPHPSPDGKWMVFVSFEKGTKGHPANQNVQLRMMPLPGRNLKPASIRVLTKLFGGQGTINVNSWAPDSKRFAFVSYELLPAEPPRPRITGVAHIALYAKDYQASRVFYRDFLGFEEPYSLQNPDGSPSMTFFKVNERQYIELFPERQAGSDRLNHISIETDDAEAMRAYLAGKGIKVPEKVGKGRIGNSNFNIKDPEGHTVEIVQYEPAGWTVREKGKYLPATRASSRILHVGIIVTRLEAEKKFYTEVLGFQETWRGSRSGTELSWVNLKVPDGEDYIELMLYKEAPPPEKRGTAHHLALETPDIASSVAALEKRPYRARYTRPIEIRTGTNRKRQSNFYDPDGTRTELMEPHTVDGKPAPPSAAPPPGL